MFCEVFIVLEVEKLDFCYFYFEENSCNHFGKLKINIFLEITVVPVVPVKQIFTDALSVCVCVYVCVCVCVWREGWVRVCLYSSTVRASKDV